MAELFYTSGEMLVFKAFPVKQFRGTHLPNSELLTANEIALDLLFSSFNSRLFHLSYRSFELKEPVVLNVREDKKFYRFEFVLAGEVEMQYPGAGKVRLLAGQYYLTQEDHYQLQFSNAGHCHYVSAAFSSHILTEMGIHDAISMNAPRPIPIVIRELIFELLQNPYALDLLPIYYEQSVRQILFLHLAAPPVVIPGGLTDKNLAAIWEADRTIADDLSTHWTIPDLARKVNTNAFTLKKGFQEVFGTAVFKRLLQRRMERAKDLLEKTTLSIQEVSQMAGYDTVAGFITSFRKRFKVTPREWRRRRQ